MSCESVHWELLLATGDGQDPRGWAAPPQQSPADRRALLGSGRAARAAREEAFPGLCFHRLHGGTSSRTVFSGLFQLSSVEAINTQG